MNNDQWHYVKGSSSVGPISTAEMEALIGQGTLGPQALVWNETLPAWEPAAQHFDFVGAGAPAVPHAGGNIGPDGLYVGAPSRGFVEAFKVCFSKYVTFSGRASRSEYWYFMLWQLIIGFATGFVDAFFLGATGDFSPLNSIASLVFFLPTMAASWRRLHDVDRSGWWIGGFYLAMIAVVFLGAGLYAGETAMMGDGGATMIFAGILGLGVIVYTILMLVFFCTRGTLGPNRFG